MAGIVAFLVAATLPLLAMLGLQARIGTMHGDLTRLGNLSTRDFGRNAPADAPPLYTHRVDAASPGVVVLGDSFSRWNQWQSQWMSWRGRNDVVTFHWDQIGGTQCLSAWARHMRARFPGARHLVIELIERSFASFLANLDKPCSVAPETTQPVATTEGAWADQRSHSPWPPPDPHHALRAWAAQFKAFSRQSRRDQVVVTPLWRSDLFTSRRPDLLLTFIDDQAKVHWKAETLQSQVVRLGSLQVELAARGVSMIVAVVPDKSTMYAPYYRSVEDRVLARVDPWQLLQTAGVRQVPLRDRLQQALPATRDLYLPDDTHFSLTGFRLMAAAVRDEVER